MKMPGAEALSTTFFAPKQIPIQRKCAQCAGGESETANTMNPLAAYIKSLPGKGETLPAETKNFFASRMGSNFDEVRVHTNSEAATSAKAINAAAYTSGENIVFDAGHYSPHTAAGKRLLAHELSHVVQQNNAPVPMVQRQQHISMSGAGGGFRVFADDDSEVVLSSVAKVFVNGRMVMQRSFGEGRNITLMLPANAQGTLQILTNVHYLVDNSFGNEEWDQSLGPSWHFETSASGELTRLTRLAPFRSRIRGTPSNRITLAGMNLSESLEQRSVDVDYNFTNNTSHNRQVAVQGGGELGLGQGGNSNAGGNINMQTGSSVGGYPGGESFHVQIQNPLQPAAPSGASATASSTSTATASASATSSVTMQQTQYNRALENVFFARDSDRIVDEAPIHRWIHNLDSEVMGQLGQHRIDIIGYASQVGDTEHNRRLARQRAQSVARIVQEAIGHLVRLNIRTHGEFVPREPALLNNPQDQRAEIQIDYVHTSTETQHSDANNHDRQSNQQRSR